MKIRLGFVSNSSSSCFIVDIPKLFKIDKNSAKGHSDAIEYLEEWDDDLSIVPIDKNDVIHQKVIDQMNRALDKLKNNQDVWEEEHTSIYWALVDIVDSYIVQSIEVGSDADRMVPLKKRKTP